MSAQGWTVERAATVPSTMDVARQRARAGAPDRWAIVAEEMSAGRGTHGRSWHAPKGGLYLSFILRGLPDVRLVSLALGNAVADTLEVAGVEPRLKWVNDVLVEGRKIAGILVEGESTGSQVDFLVAGIGINANGHAAGFPPPLDRHATTLEDALGCDACLPDLETLLLQAIDRWLGKLRDGEARQVVEAFRARDALKGRTVRVAWGDGALEGTATGIDGQGRLLVSTGEGETPLQAGTVTLL
ncbi:MAG TPA: biotin--[acetyl-CoA-carboxylase] ligase [Candidatus Thermoplasmatota archaeon]|nr:biotin--[acetyl-CoA-carboxylase] ligase [Candidatus Thermoplasmatota archaeon]